MIGQCRVLAPPRVEGDLVVLPLEHIPSGRRFKAYLRGFESARVADPIGDLGPQVETEALAFARAERLLFEAMFDQASRHRLGRLPS